MYMYYCFLFRILIRYCREYDEGKGINNGTDDDKEEIIVYLSGLLSLAFGGDEVKKDEIIEYALADTEALTTMLAYLVKYMDEYDLNADDIDKLLDMLGLNNLNSMINIKKIGIWEINLNLANIINYMKGQLTDGNEDILSKAAFSWAKKHFFDDIDIDVSLVWEKTDRKVRNITTTNGVENYQAKTGEIHDFSKNVYDTLMSTIDKINKSSFGDVSEWNKYAQFDWFSNLLISLAIKGITAYTDKLIKMNRDNKRQIEKLFDEINKIDTVNANKIKIENIIIKSIYTNLSSINL